MAAVSLDIVFLAIGAGLFSLAVSYLAVPLVIKLAWKLGIVDDPARNKHPKVIHTYPVPRGGGLGLFVAIAVASLLFLPLDKHLWGILLGGWVVVITGLWDDRYQISPYLRLGLNFLAGAIVVGAGIGIPYVSNPLGGIINLDWPRINFSLLGVERSVWILADLFALFWIAWTMNFVSMSSGLDGQMTGVIAIAAITVALMSLRYSADITQWPVIILACIVAGAFLGFLPWHIYPQKIMPGYSGATLGGFMLAVLSILSTAKVGTLMVVLAVPLLDVTYSVARRVLAGKSPVWGDRGHLHHKLLDLGWSKKKVAFFYWIVTAALGLSALILNSKLKLYTIVMLALIIGGFLLWVNYFWVLQKPPGRGSGSKI